MKKQKGFTLIELLVVIAVIGILASVVLVNLGGARETAQNSRVSAALGQIRAISEITHSRSGSYAGLCTGDTLASTGEVGALRSEISANNNSGQIRCYGNTSAYCVSAALNGGDYWCINSAGKSGKATLGCTSATAGCTGLGF